MPIKYVHTNLIATNWRSLSQFYQTVFQCTPIPPERNYSGDWLDNATGISAAHLQGAHLRLPGYGENGPTLEIFQYASMPDRPPSDPNSPGFTHIAFTVDDVPRRPMLSSKMEDHPWVN